MKRIITLLLVVCMLMLFTACGANSNNQNGLTPESTTAKKELPKTEEYTYALDLCQTVKAGLDNPEYFEIVTIEYAYDIQNQNENLYSYRLEYKGDDSYKDTGMINAVVYYGVLPDENIESLFVWGDWFYDSEEEIFENAPSGKVIKLDKDLIMSNLK